MLRCRVCKDRFSERKGTPYFDSRLPPETFQSVLDHIAEGCGVRRPASARPDDFARSIAEQSAV